jgi:hypothetical protein
MSEPSTGSMHDHAERRHPVEQRHEPGGVLQGKIGPVLFGGLQGSDAGT